MEETQKLSFTDVKNRIGEHLRTALGIQEFEITFAKQEEGVWRVNVEFEEKIGTIEWPTSASFSIDATTGEVKEYRKGYTWRL